MCCIDLVGGWLFWSSGFVAQDFAMHEVRPAGHRCQKYLHIVFLSHHHTTKNRYSNYQGPDISLFILGAGVFWDLRTCKHTPASV